MTPRVILASASRGRLDTLRRAGIFPEVIVSGVDEDAIQAGTPEELVAALATAKGMAIATALETDEPDEASPADVVLIACDSVLELDGRVCGKPGTAGRARAQWRAMRGRAGHLHTGHFVLRRHDGTQASRTRIATSSVRFANVSDAEIDAYVATGEPLGVAGAFTIDGYGGAFVERIDGDPHNVVGLSLPLLRIMLGELGVAYHSLWHVPAGLVP